MIIAIDGPSGAGKSTIGKMLAKKLGLLYLDTGAMYRAAALAALQQGVSLDDKDKIAEIAERSGIDLIGEPDNLTVMLNGVDVSTEIRTLEVAQAASVVSTISEVRRIMVRHQREIGGRDPRGLPGAVHLPTYGVRFVHFLRALSDVSRRDLLGPSGAGLFRCDSGGCREGWVRRRPYLPGDLDPERCAQYSDGACGG